MKKVILIILLLVCYCFGCSNPKQQTDNLAWLNDSLNIGGMQESSRWIDTVNTKIAFALYKGDTCILRHLFIERRQKLDTYVSVTNLDNGPVKITPLDSLDFNGEYYIVRQGILEMYNGDGNKFASATRLYNIH